MILFQLALEHRRRHITAHLHHIFGLRQFPLQRIGNFAWAVAVHRMRVQFEKKRTSEITGGAVSNRWVLGTDHPIGHSAGITDGDFVFLIAAPGKEQDQVSIKLNKERANYY